MDEKQAKKNLDEAKKSHEKENTPQTQGAVHKAEMDLKQIQDNERKKSKQPRRTPRTNKHFRRMD